MSIKSLPHEIEMVFSSCIPEPRSCQEKRFALALLKGGVENLKITSSYWAGEKPNVSGCKLHTLSIEATGGIYIDTTYGMKRHILWAILDRLEISFSGGARKKDKWAQASWHPNSDRGFYHYRNMDLPLVVCYFNQLKELDFE